MKTTGLLATTALCALLCSGSAAALSPKQSDMGHDNDVRWQKLPSWNTGGQVLDMVQSLNGKQLYVLSRGAVKIFNDEGMQQGKLLGSVPVDPGFDKLDINPEGSRIYLLNSSTGEFKPVAVVFHKEINVENAPMRGPQDAPLAITIFTDFQCPWCHKLPPVLDKVMEKNKGKVKLYFMNMPLISIHPMAESAARAGIAARNQGKFWEMHDKLFGAETLTKEGIEKFAEELGLDMDKFHADTTSKETTERLRADMVEGQRNGVDGTPYIFINGWTLGDRSAEGFQKMIDKLSAEKQ